MLEIVPTVEYIGFLFIIFFALFCIILIFVKFEELINGEIIAEYSKIKRIKEIYN
jgi:lipopolysaccharide export LptBFGC system permease protein LptF